MLPAFGHICPIASGLPDEILTLSTWFRGWLERALPEDRHVDRVAVRPDSPQEDEIPLANIQPLSVFHALYFPKHFQRLHRSRCSFRRLRAGGDCGLAPSGPSFCREDSAPSGQAATCNQEPCLHRPHRAVAGHLAPGTIRTYPPQSLRRVRLGAAWGSYVACWQGGEQ
jgi:hypothetical protein